MTTDQRLALEAEISTALSTASGTLGAVAPQFAAFALIGQAVAKVEPTLVEDVIGLFDKTQQGDPTADQEKALADKIQKLLSPETL